jgi:L-seryl-tRNA(Ser) seleniumtransferase
MASEDAGGTFRLADLPAVDEVLRSAPVEALLRTSPRPLVVAAVRAEIERLRAHGRAVGELLPVEPARIEAAVLGAQAPSLRRVINATGVVLHTNLGRAPLHPEAAARVAEIAACYSNLEFRVAERHRGSRHEHVADLLAELTGAEAALVVNNNAAAVVLALAALGSGREAVVSRGELVEIGGAFRLPEVMAAAGVTLREVGTTNKTRIADYAGALGPGTALLCKVHRSNFVQRGFVEEASYAEVAELARAAGVISLADVGSGVLVRPPEGLLRRLVEGEPTVAEVVRAGFDVVTFSGDKVLGGPQAGILVGRSAAVARARAHPLMRALRPDKMTLAALAATLELYRDGRSAELPACAMLAATPEALAARADQLLAGMQEAAPGLQLERVAMRSAVGGGALPDREPESFGISITAPGRSADELDLAFRAGSPPIVGRIAEGRYLLDVRTLLSDDILIISAAARSVAAGMSE